MPRPIQTYQCRETMEVNGVFTPNDWEDEVGAKPDSVSKLDFDDSYIRSAVYNQGQWFTFTDPAIRDNNDYPIRGLFVNAMVRQPEGGIGAAFLGVGIGSDTIGGSPHKVFPGWNWINEYFDLTPLSPISDPPRAWKWEDLEFVTAGIFNLTLEPHPIDCTYFSISINFCNYTACPRCCCCCLCFTPILHFGGFTFDLIDAGDTGGTITLGGLVLPMPFCQLGAGTLPGCFFRFGASIGDCTVYYDSMVVGEGDGASGWHYTIRLIDATILANVLNAEGNCALVHMTFVIYNETLGGPAKTIVIGPQNTTLDQCEPYHESHIDAEDISYTDGSSPITDPPLHPNGEIRVTCDGDMTGALPAPGPP